MSSMRSRNSTALGDNRKRVSPMRIRKTFDNIKLSQPYDQEADEVIIREQLDDNE